jgi:hypothetical protein
MSSIVDSRSPAVQCDRALEARPASGIWPVGARCVLAAVALAGALALQVASQTAESPSAAAALPELRVDPNTVPGQVLEALPHVGPTLVEHWVAAREDRPFASLDDARRRVRGLGPATLAELAPYLTFPAAPQYHREKPARSHPDRRRVKIRAPRGSTPHSATAWSFQPRLAARPFKLDTREAVAIAHHE